MRVAHLLRKLNPAEWGGTETAIHRLCEGLRSHGVTPVVYCPRLEHDKVEDPLAQAGFDVQRYKAFVPVLGISPERKRQLVSVGGNIMSFELLGALWRDTSTKVVHTHALGRIGAIGRTIARSRNLPFVVSIHGGVLDLPSSLKREFNAPNRSGWEWGRVLGLVFRSHRLFESADAILTCNEKEAVLLKEKYPGKRILVQPHGVPISNYRQDCRDAAQSAFPMLRGKRVVLNVGRIDPVKNQAWMLEQAPELLRRHKDAMLVLAGPCTDEPYGAALERRIRELGVQDRVLQTGGMASSDPRLIGLMQLADALVLCSVSETFGLILLESWAAGTVVISSATSGAKALIRDGHNGWLFELDRPEQFHVAIERALADPASAQKMAVAGAKLVEQCYSVEALAGRVKWLYEQLMEARLCVT